MRTSRSSMVWADRPRAGGPRRRARAHEGRRRGGPGAPHACPPALREACDPRDASRSVGSEVALARRCSPSLGDRFVGLARALIDEVPHTMAALSSGACSEHHAVALVRATAGHRPRRPRAARPRRRSDELRQRQRRLCAVQPGPGGTGVAVAVRDPLAGPGTEADARELVVTTGVGPRYSSVPPPLLGWGSTPGVEGLPGHALRAPASAAVRPGAGRVVRGRRVSQRPAKRPLLTSRLGRELCRSLT